MNPRWRFLMCSVAVPAMALSFSIAAGHSAALAQNRIGNAPAEIQTAQIGQGSGRIPHGSSNRVSKGDQEYLGSASRIKDLPPPKQPVEIATPSDPVAAKAFQVLDKHCARCHQEGRLTKRDKPAKDFGNVLRLDEIARNPNLIRPGNADGSPLFTQIVNRQMPYDVFQENSGGAEPTTQDLDALRDWIDSLNGGEKTVASVCGSRERAGLDSVVAAIASDINKEQASRRSGLRYVTLTHLYNSCADDKEMTAYRQAVVKLLNSLSKNADVLKLQTIDDAKTIVRFHLDDLNWSENDWNRILAAYPYAMKIEGDGIAAVERETRTPLAWVRGDWLAYTAARPPLYHDLLKLPESYAELQSQLSIETSVSEAPRIGFRESGESPNNRLLERRKTSDGVFWTAYNFSSEWRRRDLFAYPQGPNSERSFEHDGNSTAFTLPNGFNGYFLSARSGQRIDSAPTDTLSDESQGDETITNGISCMGCHVQGFQRAKDELRDHVASNDDISQTGKDAVAARHPSAEEINRLFDEDINRFRTAMREAGLDPDLDLNGVEIIAALARRYEHNVDLRLAAAEFGVTENTLREMLDDGGIRAFWIKRRLEQGTVPRATFENRFGDLVKTVAGRDLVDTSGLAVSQPAPVATVSDDKPADGSSFELTLFSDKSVYKQNDLAVFTVETKKSCHLTLINVDGEGNGTVIFPNRFQQENFLKANTPLKFPADDAKFQFRLKDKGTESVIAVCNSRGKTTDGIEHDFKTRSFTALGNYRKFLNRQISVEGILKGTAQAQESSGGSGVSSQAQNNGAAANTQSQAQNAGGASNNASSQAQPQAQNNNGAAGSAAQTQQNGGGTATASGKTPSPIVRTAIRFEVK